MTDAPDVLFVCQHGAAKSVVAARHLEELARSHGLTLNTAAAGIEPDEAIPPHVIAGLGADGIHHHDTVPQALTRELIDRARIVVSLGCDLSAFTDASHSIVEWNDVPHVSDGYEAARTVIVGHLQAMLDEAVLRGSRKTED